MTQSEAQQAIDFLAFAVEQNDYDGGLGVFSQFYGEGPDDMAALLGQASDAAMWLRSRTLVGEAADYYIFELTAVGEFKQHIMRVHRQSSSPQGAKHAGIEL